MDARLYRLQPQEAGSAGLRVTDQEGIELDCDSSQYTTEAD